MNIFISYYKRFPKVVWTLIFITLIESFGRFMVIPYLSLHLLHKGIKPSSIGIILSAAPFAGIAMGIIGGHISDTIGRKPVQFLGLLFSGIALTGFGLPFINTLFFIILSFLNGMTRSFFRPATNAAIADVTPLELRAEAYGLRRVVINIGATLGPLTGFWLYSQKTILGFFIGGGLNIAMAFVLLFFLKETKTENSTHLDKNIKKKTALNTKDLLYILKDIPLWLSIVGTGIQWGVYSLIQSFVPIHFVNQNIPAWVYSTIIPLNAILCVIFQLPINFILRKSHMGIVMFLSMIPYAISFFGFGFTALPILIITSMIILTFGEIIQASATTRFIPELAPPHLLGRYLGISELRDIGIIAMTLFAGVIMEKKGGHSLFIYAGILALAAGFINLLSDNIRLIRLKNRIIN